MSDTGMTEPRAPLGVGAIVSESFSILFKNLVPIAVVSIIPIVLSIVLSGMLMGFDAVLGGGPDPENIDDLNGYFVGLGIASLVGIILYGIIIATLVQLAYDAKLGRPLNYVRYYSAAIATLLPNVVLMIIVTILVSLAAMLLLIPGLWLMALYSVVVPALVIEGAGFGSMRRSQTLTKEYRWPVFGALLLVYICSMILNLGVVFIAGAITSAMGSVGTLVGIVMLALVYVASYGLISIAVSLIYARLREIKEGVGVDQLAAVFE